MDVATLLLEKGAEPNAENAEGWTPLHRAARSESLDVVRKLLEHGAKVEAHSSEDAYTPLIVAAQVGRVETMELPVPAQHPAAPRRQHPRWPRR